MAIASIRAGLVHEPVLQWMHPLISRYAAVSRPLIPGLIPWTALGLVQYIRPRPRPPHHPPLLLLLRLSLFPSPPHTLASSLPPPSSPAIPSRPASTSSQVSCCSVRVAAPCASLSCSLSLPRSPSPPPSSAGIRNLEYSLVRTSTRTQTHTHAPPPNRPPLSSAPRPL